MSKQLSHHQVRDASTNEVQMLVIRGDAHGMTIDIGAYHAIVIDVDDGEVSVHHWENDELTLLGEFRIGE